MVAYGYPEVDLDSELALAVRFGVELLEILPEWSRFPDPRRLRRGAADRGLSIHSAHGCWGGRTIRARRVDLGATDVIVHRESVDDLKRCAEWLEAAGGTCLVVHPGGLSEAQDREPRRAALARGLLELAEHAAGLRVRICVENMPPGVHPGSRMAELAELLTELNHPNLALALDTGHANLTATAHEETRTAGPLLATTHVHDNNGQQDSHLPPGYGTVDWPAWGRALDAIAYTGPIMLECIRHLRQHPTDFRPEVLRGICQFRRTEFIPFDSNETE
jgi:sugar phosphate isomerase/epimerase